MDDARDLLFDEAVGLLYEAALTPSLLPEALKAMTQLLDGDVFHLVGWDRDSGIPCLNLSSGFPEQAGRDYADYYVQIDPRHALSPSLPPGHVLACHEHFDDRFVGQNEFYQDHLIPLTNIRYLLGAGDLIPASQDLIVMGFHRYIDHGHFNEDHKRLLTRFLPHMRRMLRMRTAQAASREAGLVGTVSGHVTHLSILTLSESGRLLQANQQGEALLRQGQVLTLRHGVLTAAAPNANATLRTALRQAASGRIAHLTLSGAEPSQSLYITLMPAPQRDPHVVGDSQAAVVALGTSTGPHRVTTVDQLMAYFRLTPAEARLVRALCHGLDLEDYAAQEGLKTTTVRTHLNSALVKTGTTKQKDLVAAVLALPAVRHSESPHR